MMQYNSVSIKMERNRKEIIANLRTGECRRCIYGREGHLETEAMLLVQGRSLTQKFLQGKRDQ